MLLLWAIFFPVNLFAQSGSLPVYPADHPHIQYTGRIDFTNPKLPRFWQPAVSIALRVEGNSCELIIQDEVIWGSDHNYLELVVDDITTRLQTKSKRDTINVSNYFSPARKVHDVLLVKNTEANIGYLEFVAVRCSKLLPPPPKPARRIEFIGNSITCGAGSDLSEIPCDKGKWYDQHNAYMSYGAVLSRTVNAQYHLSSVSGIGLMHSCCNMNIIMPQVFDKISMRNDSIEWDFKKYQPDLVTVGLGQNDGVQDSSAFCNNYISFLKKLRQYYPQTEFLLISSPMADDRLRNFMQSSLAAIQNSMNKTGDKKVHSYIFGRQYSSGCGYHPSLEEHKMIAAELALYVKKLMHWQL